MTTQKQIVAVMKHIGKLGGNARALALTPERRSQISRKAALAKHAKAREGKAKT